MIPLLLLALQADPVFKANLDLIRVQVQVTREDKAVPGLTKDDFLILDQGTPQEIIAVETDTQPLDLIILIDVSNSMTGALRQLKQKSAVALRHLRDIDRVAVLSFGTSLKIEYPLTQDFDSVKRAIREMRGHRPGTELNKNILQSAQYLSNNSRPSARHAILLLTDNHGDRGVPDSQVLDLLWASDSILHSLIFENPKIPTNPKPHVEIFSDSTGGEIFRANEKDLQLAKIVDQLRMRYTLVYRAPSAGPRSQTRQIEVKLAKPHPANTQIHFRTGYTRKEF
jgi:VWFA-related protein